MLGLAEFAPTGGEERAVDLTAVNRMWQHPWHIIHRALLHNKLREAATTETGPGSPAVLHTSAKVTSVDCEAGRIILADGTSIDADVIVGADGIYVSNIWPG
jgi:2-polyprenyl-6-methoxyphenol hydroxylase-like FAD-dependent oxidoreductase